jgi:uncharacterized membrane protein
MAADVDSQIAAAEEKVKGSEKALEKRLKDQQADDRSHLAKVIIWAFIALMAFVVLTVPVGLLFFSDWNKIAEPAKFLMTILSSVMLPVVTLIIGHYFGNR